jgi:23S rRNA pseudouridine1911/1915/1917 synthase
MGHIGCPVLCDKLYSGRASVTLKDFSGRASDADQMVLERQALHAHRIEFDHPATGDRMKIEAPLPADIVATLEALKQFRS